MKKAYFVPKQKLDQQKNSWINFPGKIDNLQTSKEPRAGHQPIHDTDTHDPLLLVKK